MAVAAWPGTLVDWREALEGLEVLALGRMETRVPEDVAFRTKPAIKF